MAAAVGHELPLHIYEVQTRDGLLPCVPAAEVAGALFELADAEPAAAAGLRAIAGAFLQAAGT